MYSWNSAGESLGSGGSVSFTVEVEVVLSVTGFATLPSLHDDVDAIPVSGPGAAAAMVENGFRLCPRGAAVCVWSRRLRPFRNPSSGEQEKEGGSERALYSVDDPVDDPVAVVVVGVNVVNVTPREI